MTKKELIDILNKIDDNDTLYIEDSEGTFQDFNLYQNLQTREVIISPKLRAYKWIYNGTITTTDSAQNGTTIRDPNTVLHG